MDFGPRETVQLFSETKRYLARGDGQLTQEQHLALLEMLFYLAMFCGEDIEAQVVYNQIGDRLGDQSCKLQVMKATLLQFNESPEAAIKYLDGLIREEYEFSTDVASYCLLCKKLLSLRMYYSQKKLDQAQWIQEINGLLERCPLDPELWWFLAQLYSDNKQYEYAIHCLQEVLLIMPFNYVAFAKLSEVYMYQSSLTGKNHSEKLQFLKLALDNALRSVELSETFLKGWTLVKLISEKLKTDHSKTRIIQLADKKLKEIKSTSNETDRFVANYVLSQS